MYGIFSFLSQRFLKGQVIVNSKHKFIFFYFWNVYLFLVVLGLHCCTLAFSSYGKQGATLQLWCVGFSLQQLLLLLSKVSRCSNFSHCSKWAQWLWRTRLVDPQQMESSHTRDQTHVPCIGRWILNHCTTREVLQVYF